MTQSQITHAQTTQGQVADVQSAYAKTTLHIIGASGYGAGEILRLCRNHPYFTFGALESGSAVGTEIGDTFFELRRLPIGARTFDARGSVYERAQPGDIVILAGSHELADEAAPQLRARNIRVLDLSDGFRQNRAASGSTYGLTERYRDEIRTAGLVANPGCFPTTTFLSLLPLAPFAAAMQALILDIKSGISGAGRTPKVGSLFSELDGELRPYGLTGHRHVPEIALELGAAGITAPFTFTPQVMPVTRGMFGMIYVVFSNAPAIDEIDAAFAAAYDESPFVNVLRGDVAPSLRAVARSNNAEISYSLQGATLRIFCAIDNLGKGAAGQAVQNLNVMCGYPEETSLL